MARFSFEGVLKQSIATTLFIHANNCPSTYSTLFRISQTEASSVHTIQYK